MVALPVGLSTLIIHLQKKITAIFWATAQIIEMEWRHCSNVAGYCTVRIIQIEYSTL